MGGIVETGLSVKSDRSGKSESVTDEKIVEWYKDFAKTKDKDDLMVTIIINGPESIVGKDSKVIEYEYVTPKELETILGYVVKAEPPKPRKSKAVTVDSAEPAPPAEEEKTVTGEQGEKEEEKEDDGDDDDGDDDDALFD